MLKKLICNTELKFWRIIMDRDKKEEYTALLTSLASQCQSCTDTEKIANLIKFQHRTYQQSIGRFIQEAIKVYAKMYEDGIYDLRNEGICKMCNNIVDKVEDVIIPFI